MDWLRFKYVSKLGINRSRKQFPIHLQLSRTWTSSENHHNEDRGDRDFGYIVKRVQQLTSGISLGLLFLSGNAVKAGDVGGISATSNPVANSSGQATVNAYQVLTGNFINSAFTNGVQCQSETVTISPYIGRSRNVKRPFETSYKEPVYDMRANDAGDLLNPGGILFEKDILTQQRDNYSLNFGATLQWSKPLDKKLQALCKEAAGTEIALRKATLNLRVLDYEISRMRHCGEQMQKGISFAPDSAYASICRDIRVSNFPKAVPNHAHTIPIISEDSSVLNVVHERKAPWASSSTISGETSSEPSSQGVSQP